MKAIDVLNALLDDHRATIECAAALQHDLNQQRNRADQAEEEVRLLKRQIESGAGVTLTTTIAPDREQRLRKATADIVWLEDRIRFLRETNVNGKGLEQRQALVGDLAVAEANLARAQSDAFWLKMNLDPLAKA